LVERPLIAATSFRNNSSTEITAAVESSLNASIEKDAIKGA